MSLFLIMIIIILLWGGWYRSPRSSTHRVRESFRIASEVRPLLTHLGSAQEDTSLAPRSQTCHRGCQFLTQIPHSIDGSVAECQAHCHQMTHEVSQAHRQSRLIFGRTPREDEF